MIAPTVNSYKRTGALTTASGASWAPRNPTYGGNDRTHYIRVPDDQRIELRGGDGSANPYLAIAAALGAGLDGIKRSTDPGAVGAVGADRSTLPPTLLHAVDALEADPVITGVLDAAGDGCRPVSYFAALKRDEFFAYHSAVSAVGGRPVPDRVLIGEKDNICAASSGLHLRNPSLYPRLGELLTGDAVRNGQPRQRFGRCRRLRRPDSGHRRAAGAYRCSMSPPDRRG